MKLLLVVFLVFLSVLVLSYDRLIKMEVYLHPDGVGEVMLHEEVYRGDLLKIYVEHQEEMNKNRELKKEFLRDISKEFYYLYGSAPKPHSIDIKGYKVGSKFVRDIFFKVPGLIEYDYKRKVFVFSRKHFRKEGDALGFFEEFLDGKFFESAFVVSDDLKYLETRRVTIIHLPKESDVKDLSPVFSKKLIEKWNKDYGRGNILKGEIAPELKLKGTPMSGKNELIIVVNETEITGREAPDILLSGKNQEFFQTLRDIGAFDVHFVNKGMSPKKLTEPVVFNPKWDFSSHWTYNLSINASKKFCDGSTCLTPGVGIGTNFRVDISWSYHWVKTGWWRWKYVFNKFEGKISINPYAQVYVNLHASSSRNRSWSHEILSKDKVFTFWVSGVPVVIVLKGTLEAKAYVGVSGAIDINASTKFNVNTWVKFKYQHGWSRSYGRSYSYSGVSFSANANLNAYAKGELPVSFVGYIYYVAGPYLELTPWIKGETNAQGGTSGNQVGYKVTGGLKLDGGVKMAGWLKNVCGHIGSVNYTIWSKTWTLKSGTYTF